MHPLSNTLVLLFLLFFPNCEALALTARPAMPSAELNISTAPSRADWQYFMRADSKFKKKLWHYYKDQGKSLKDWAWEWRVGWVQTCQHSQEAWCWQLFKAALFDQALVVRSEAAVRLGERFRGSANPDIVTLLSSAYKNPANLRSGKPLFIQERLLFAIKSVGGAISEREGLRLAELHPKTRDYWHKLAQ